MVSLFNLFVELEFGFNPAIYEYEEDVGTGSLSVSLMEGDLGEFILILIAATFDNSTATTALGIKFIGYYCLAPYYL